MINTTASLFCALLIIPSLLVTSQAATYKCTAENGDITYSQTPCKQNQTTNTILTSPLKSETMEDCKYAGAFSKMIFRRMRSGYRTQHLYDSFGGLHAISESTLGIINYVYSFKHASATRSDRVAFLTVTKCNAKTFGEVRCEDFPEQFQDTIYSCDEIEREQALKLHGLLEQSIENQLQFDEFSISPSYGSSNNSSGSGGSYDATRQKYEKAKIAECKERYESKIERINDRLSKGYSVSLGESLRDKKRSLRKNMASQCR